MEQQLHPDTTVDPRERGSMTANSSVPPFRVLLVLTTASSSSVVELEDGAERTVGRAAPADILLPDPSLSRLHARLRREGESVRITDLGSRNGTWVGGQRVEESVARVGGTFVLGSVTITVQLAPPLLAASLGLSSAATMLAQIEEECARSRAFGRPLSVLMLRAARRGQPGASELGARCLRVLRPSDRVGLYDRDTLLALLPETPTAEATRIADRLVRSSPTPSALLCGVASLSERSANAEPLVSAALRALREASASRQVACASSGIQVRPASRETMVRRSAAMLELQRMVERLAPRTISVLLLGETGTGKELIARELHERSERARGPLQVVNCAAIPEHLTESVLFGHVRGAFTGAHRDQPGVFTQAHGGTIFLDEVGELSSAAQAALLRVLDTRKLCPIGGAQEQEVDVRVIAATHRDLATMAERGTFRLDLYHRLNSVVLRIPPLRERPEEIVPLMEHFLASGTPAPVLSEDAVAHLLAYRWPGNVRELRNVAERALALCEGDRIECRDLPLHIGSIGSEPAPAQRAPSHERISQPQIDRPSQPPAERHSQPPTNLDLRAVLRQKEVSLIKEALRRSQGNQRRAAGLLRLPLRTLERKLRILGVRSHD